MASSAARRVRHTALHCRRAVERPFCVHFACVKCGVGIDRKELGGHMLKSLKFCPGIEILH